MTRERQDTPRTREAIERVGREYREQAAKAGNSITQTQAEERVKGAIRSTERKHKEIDR